MYRPGIQTNVGRIRMGEQGVCKYDVIRLEGVPRSLTKIYKYALSHSRKGLSGQCGFMAANMYAKSIFGEDALANMSIEKPLNKPDAPVVGHIRIRAKSQGMACR